MTNDCNDDGRVTQEDISVSLVLFKIIYILLGKLGDSLFTTQNIKDCVNSPGQP